MAQSGMGEILKWGVLGVGGWWLYETYFKTPPSALGPAGTPSAGATPAVGLPVTVAPSQLATIYTAMVAKAAADGITVAGPDTWNVYAIRGGAPDPMPAPEDAGLTRVDMTPAVYWAAMSPVLKAQKGLSGADHFAGLGALYGFGGSR